jgi:hypothetical protein
MKKCLLIAIYIVWSIPIVLAQFNKPKAHRVAPGNDILFENYLQSANRGDAKAMYMVGEFYANGIDRPSNPKEALVWYKKAAVNGDPRAWYRMGLLYKYGKGTSLDYRSAFDCFVKAGEGGNARGLFSEGYMLYKGIGCQQNYERAYSLFVTASEANIREAMYFRGLCCRNGYGTSKNEVEAKKWLQLAIIKGDQQAQSELFSPDPENTNEVGIWTAKLRSAEKINNRKNSSIHSYNDEDHDKRIKESDITGSYTGFLIKYDWSGKHAISAAKLSLTLQKSDNGLEGTWIEDDSIRLNIKTKLLDSGLDFGNAEYKKKDHYNPIAAKLRFDLAKLHILKTADTIFLTGNLQVFAIEKKEPEKPQRFFLTRTLPIQKNAQGPSKTMQTVLTEENASFHAKLQAFPNPFLNSINLQFTLAKNSVLKAAIYDGAGRQVYNGSENNYLKGVHKMVIQLTVPAGVYFVKLLSGYSEIASTKIIKE